MVFSPDLIERNRLCHRFPANTVYHRAYPNRQILNPLSVSTNCPAMDAFLDTQRKFRPNPVVNLTRHPVGCMKLTHGKIRDLIAVRIFLGDFLEMDSNHNGNY